MYLYIKQQQKTTQNETVKTINNPYRCAMSQRRCLSFRRFNIFFFLNVVLVLPLPVV